MKKAFLILPLLTFLATSAPAQEITVTPSTVTAYSQGATSVFLTFGNVRDKRPVDACFCAEVIPAQTGVGFQCDPAKIFGCLPVRYDQSRASGNNAYTDIMSIPPSVARRAYIDAAAGAEATFFYVRRFVSLSGGPDEFVPVTIRLSGNGASVPFSLTNVKLSWGVDKPVLLIKPGEKLPRIQAEIAYTGTGRLKGRWELVKPGEELPDRRDLLTEATLPVEERGLQRRYTELSRFNVFLPPTGRFILPGPEVWRVPSTLVGQYLVLLRIEAAEDPNGNANLPGVGAGPAAVPTGGVAGFPMPVLRYYVGSGSAPLPVASSGGFALVSPDENAVLSLNSPIELRWSEMPGAVFYRVEIEDLQGQPVLQAIRLPGAPTYQAPSWLGEKLGGNSLRWRVVALDRNGKALGETPRRILRLGN
ncbi:MAG TPA: hypothetical protein VNO70_08625 [Blastocatellia bacterium]|nr:hypothetical protein [Blastocatellia bacterium]